LEIRIGGVSVSVTMRTPGSDFELVAGFLHAEGVIASRADFVAMRYCGVEPQNYNVVDVELLGGRRVEPLRTTLTTSACGVCGAASIESIRARSRHDVASDDVAVSSRVLSALPARMREAQGTFARTGGLHAAALYSDDGRLLEVREDVGRHNAMDKIIGCALLADALPLRRHVVLVSGRASFELVQKAYAAGVPLLAAVSAPSTLAAELANDAGMTLVAFLRGESMNVYTRPERVACD
jgi:FdhD protein